MVCSYPIKSIYLKSNLENFFKWAADLNLILSLQPLQPLLLNDMTEIDLYFWLTYLKIGIWNVRRAILKKIYFKNSLKQSSASMSIIVTVLNKNSTSMYVHGISRSYYITIEIQTRRNDKKNYSEEIRSKLESLKMSTFIFFFNLSCLYIKCNYNIKVYQF